jgi:hypothetical protein
VKLRQISLDVGGQFGPDRLLGAVEQHDGQQFATVSADYSVAQSFTLSPDLIKRKCRCSGISCFFRTEAQAELYVEIQKDAGGFPATGAPLANANLIVVPPEKAQGILPWTFAGFAAPAELQTGVPYWIVVKGVRGLARLGLQSLNPTAGPLAVERTKLYINRGGQLWKSMFRSAPVPDVVALLGVVYLPGADDQSAAVQIRISANPPAGEALVQSVDPGKTPATIRLDGQEANWNRSTLEVRSNGQGTLSIANVIRVYRLVH